MSTYIYIYIHMYTCPRTCMHMHMYLCRDHIVGLLSLTEVVVPMWDLFAAGGGTLATLRSEVGLCSLSRLCHLMTRQPEGVCLSLKRLPCSS